MPPGGVKRHRKSGSTPAAASGTFCVLPEWRNWYTRATQNRVPSWLVGSNPTSGTSRYGPLRMSDGFRDVGAVGEFAERTVSARQVGDRRVLICAVAGELYAVANRCTHAAWELDDAPLQGCALVCGLHGAHFDVRNGSPGPPASKPLQTFPLRVREQRVQVRVP